MTREHKIALIVGFALVLLVGVAVSDHLSEARRAQLETGLAGAEGDAGAVALSAPIPAPVATIAASPERPTHPPSGSGAADYSFQRERVGMVGGQDPRPAADTRPPVTEFLTRLRDRIEDMPIAAATSREAGAPGSGVSSAPERPRDGGPDARQPGGSPDSVADRDVVWHSVKEGETLWSIAASHYGNGSLAGKLAEFNGAEASNLDLIRVGVRLRIPPLFVLTGERPPTITHAASDPSPSTPYRLYTIKKGDTLGEISMRELGTIRRMNEIIKLNPVVLRDPDTAPIGAAIRLPLR